MQSIGAFFQCYKNPRATYETLKSFRNHYPSNTVVLLSDNGYDYTEMAKYFNCIYMHETENVPFTIRLDTDPHDKSQVSYYTILCNKEDFLLKGNKLIKRFVDVFKLLKEEYILILEDDVYVHNIITDKFKYDLNGYCPNSFQKKCIDELVKKYNIDTNKLYHYSGHGGSVYNKEILLDCLKNTIIIDDILDNWTNYNFDELCCDLFISLLLTINGKTIGPYDGHNDSSNAIIQHQYKIWYGKELPEELKYLVKCT